MVRKRIYVASLVLLAGAGVALVSPGAAEAQRRGSQRGGGSYENGSYGNQPYGYQANSVYGSDQAVHVQVRVPREDAKIWFENQQTRQNGIARDFESPPLQSGYTYRYTIRARWQENGRTVERTRSLHVRAGETKLVDFTQPAVDGAEQASNGNNRSVKARGSAHYGKVVSVTGNELVMTGKNGKQHSHIVAANTKVTCDGTPCQLADLEPGWRIRVITSSTDTATVTRIDALKRNQAFADKGSNNAGRTSHDGKIVSVTGNTLVMTGKNGKEHSHTVAARTKITCDGTPCQLADLEPGLRIRVTTSSTDPARVTRIDALKQNQAFADKSSNNAGRTSHDGKVVSVTGNKLVMTGTNGKEHSHIVAANAKVTCDGALCQLADLEPGWRIRVTIRTNDNAVGRIEALNNNESFKKRN
jgi:uncharacterized protein (TIGR03000 family)